MIVTQKGKNVEYEDNNVLVILGNCNALKLIRTLYNKTGNKYSKEQMKEWGFELK